MLVIITTCSNYIVKLVHFLFQILAGKNVRKINMKQKNGFVNRFFVDIVDNIGQSQFDS